MGKNSKRIRELCAIALTAALLCVSALVYIPLAVPITLQTLVLFLSLFTLGGRSTSIATAVYISIGAVGLPVFSGFSGGISRLFDPTGGYIIGMLLASLVYWIFEEIFPKNKATEIIKPTISMLIIYIFGTLWFTFMHTNGENSLIFIVATCVIPFVIPDAIKIIFARILSSKITAAIKKQSSKL